MYKVYNNPAPGYLIEFQMREGRLDSTLSNLRPVANKNYVLPQAKCNLFKGSLSFSGVVIWNSIPLEIKQSSSLNILANGALNGSKVSYILITLPPPPVYAFFSPVIANCEIVYPCVKIKDKLKMFQHQTSKTIKTLCSIK